MRPNFFHHLHPPTIPAEQSRWRYTLGAGGISVFLVLILGITGILEMFYYNPNPAEAAQSIQIISYHVPFGGFIRNMHYWSAQLLVLVSGIHLLRVIFTGAYAAPRRFNYLLGLGLFVTLILVDFTGYVLRWDQDICWALVTGTNLLKTIPWVGPWLFSIAVGGQNACESALLRFYTWHIFALILPAVVLMVWHLFRVRRDGGIAVPPPDGRPTRERITRFELVRREVLAMLLSGVILILLAVFLPAPIGAPITGQPLVTEEARAPWFFLWVQEMLKWGSPLFWGVLVPAFFLLLLALIPYIFTPPAPVELGRWFPPSARSAQITAGILFFVVLLLSLKGLLS
ncbi:MAG: cytochrome b N-terminal domain-containing protein [Anaerolineales bacterium]